MALCNPVPAVLGPVGRPYRPEETADRLTCQGPGRNRSPPRTCWTRAVGSAGPGFDSLTAHQAKLNINSSL